MNCTDYLAARLGGGDGPDLDAHRAECVGCSGAGGDLTLIAAMLADADLWAEPPDSLEDRLMAEVAADGVEGSEDGARPIQLLRVAEPPARRRPWLGWAAVAAVVVGVTIPVLRANEPDWEQRLSGAGPTPGASATVVGWATEQGTRMVIDTEGLPPAPDGYVYELWLSSDDVHVSAGSFLSGEGVEMWTGVRRADFPHLWVTLEPVDEDAAASGETVLDADA